MSMQVRPESDITVGGMMELAFRHIFAMYAHRLRHPLYVYQPYVSQACTQGGGVQPNPPFVHSHAHFFQFKATIDQPKSEFGI